MSEFVTRDGVRIAYGQSGEGRAIVLVPGLFTSSHWWSRQVDELATRFRVVTLDLRGTGASERTVRGARISRLAADVHELIVHLDLTEVVLVGWSMGCSIAMSYVDLFGADRLAHLILVEGSPKLISDDDWAFGFADFDSARAIVGSLPGSYADTVGGLSQAMLVDHTAEPEFAALAAEGAGTSADFFAPLMWNHLVQDWRDVVPRITVPTTVVAGTASAIITPDASRWVTDRIPGARLELFEGCGHALFREQPERFNRLVAAAVEG